MALAQQSPLRPRLLVASLLLEEGNGLGRSLVSQMTCVEEFVMMKSFLPRIAVSLVASSRVDARQMFIWIKTVWSKLKQ